MVEIDPKGLVIGLGAIAFLFFILGFVLGTWYQEHHMPRLRSKPPYDEPPYDEPPAHHQFPGYTEFQRWVVAELRVMRGELLERLTQLEKIMVSNANTLVAAVNAAETKIDGYVAIMNGSAKAMRDAVAALAALKDEPTAEDIDHVIGDLNIHLMNADAAAQSLSQASTPVAPADGPVPQPAPAASPPVDPNPSQQPAVQQASS